jgi:hypothetical protein
MTWWLTGGDDAVVAGIAGTYDGGVIYSKYTAKSNRVMAIFTVISTVDVSGRFADSYAIVMAVLAWLHDITVIIYCTCP